MNNEPIDAVITWVDGKDPLHKQKLAPYLKRLNLKPESADPTRFSEVGEFEYCIASLLRFAPWLRKIFIVTDSQTPIFWNQIQNSKFANKFELVTHDVVFNGYEDVLPTFNCRSIFTLMWSIPGLSERYIYLDDDFVLLQPTTPETFFQNQNLILRGKWELQQKHRLLSKLIPEDLHKNINSRVGNRRGQAFAAEKAGYKKRYFRSPHNPHPQFISLQASYYQNNPKELTENIKYKFRSDKQFVSTALTTHLAFKNNRAIIVAGNSTIRLKMDKITSIGLKSRLWFADMFSKRFLFGCFQSLDMANEKKYKSVIAWLNKRIGTLEMNLK